MMRGNHIALEESDFFFQQMIQSEDLIGGDKFTIVGDCGLRNIVIVNDNQGQIGNDTVRSD